MQFRRTCVEAISYALPAEILTSDEIEARLAPVYERLRLPAGRLELMTGIRSRRLWPRGMSPGAQSVRTAADALAASGAPAAAIGLLIHGSVCRDHLEPATASSVHHGLGLSSTCQVYDVSNACLGLLNGVWQAAALIELGEIQAAIVVGTEDSRPLLETTIDALNRDESLTRESIKLALASLTIGSGSAAIVLVDEALSRHGRRLRAGVTWADTTHHQLCLSGRDEAAVAMRPLMSTDSEALLHAGVAAARRAFDRFLGETGWRVDEIEKTVCHQVGSTHRRPNKPAGLPPATGSPGSALARASTS
jgi:acyl-CoA:acyl-CoA alkyltransferase